MLQTFDALIILFSQYNLWQNILETPKMLQIFDALTVLFSPYD